MSYLEEKRKLYNKLSYDQKKQFISEILSELKTDENVFSDMHNIVQAIDDVQESFLDMCFETVFGAIQGMKDQDNQKNQEKLIAIKEKLKNLKFLEAQDKENEDIDLLLKLDNL